MQKLNCILKICFNNYEPNPRAEKTTKTKKQKHSIQSKQNGVLEFAVRPGYSHCVQTQRMLGKGTNVKGTNV